MDMLDNMSGTQRCQLALTSGPAAHIAGRDRALFAQKDGAARKRHFVLLVSDLESGYYSESSWQGTLLSNGLPIDLGKPQSNQVTPNPNQHPQPFAVLSPCKIAVTCRLRPSIAQARRAVVFSRGCCATCVLLISTPSCQPPCC